MHPSTRCCPPFQFRSVGYICKAVQEICRTFPSCKIKTLSLSNIFLCCPTASPGHTILPSVPRSWTTSDTSPKWNRNINFFFFVTVLFHLTPCPPGSSMLQHTTISPSFSRLRNVLSCAPHRCFDTLFQQMVSLEASFNSDSLI